LTNRALPGGDARRFIALDGLRGVAAIAVLLFYRRWWSSGAFEYGYLAVDFFFVLSGFVIAHAYGERLASGRLGLREFSVLRAIRLGPLVVLGAALGTLVTVLDTLQQGWVGRAVQAVAGFPLAAVLLPVPWAAVPFGLNEPSWSLFFEVIGNLAFALVVGWLTPRRLGWTIAVFAAGIVLILVATGTITWGYSWSGFALGLPRMLGTFFLGIGVHHLWSRGLLPRIGLPFWALCLILIAVLCFVPQLAQPWSAVFVGVCVLLVFPFIVASGTQSEPTGHWQKLAEKSAELSYPVYILHYPLLGAFDLWHRGQPTHPMAWFVGQSVLICILAYIVGQGLDVPFRRRLNAWRKARRPLPA
jgi:peptidoglycan/LPS O-acetylase OafA/YrhL